MSRSLGLAIPLWFLHDSTEALEQALGEVGPQHVTATVVAGGHTTIRLRGPAPHVIAHRGGWQYPPDTAAYTDAGLKPPRDTWFGKRNLLAKLQDLLARYDIPLVARLHPTIAGLAEAHPHLAGKTAWDEPLPQRPACPAHPETRALLLDLVSELKDYGATALQLGHWLTDPPLPATGTLAGNAPARELLGLCFCPACQQIARSAGADPDAAAETARMLLNQSATTAATLPGDGPLADYRSARRGEARTWLQVLRQRTGQRGLHLLLDPGQTSPTSEIPVQRNLSQAPAPLDTATWFQDATAINLPIQRPHIPQPDALVRITLQLLQHGVHWIDFDGLASDPDHATMTSVRQAIRYAQRT